MAAYSLLAEAATAAALSCSATGIVPSPSPGSFDVLAGIAALSPDDAWAAGNYIDAGGFDQTLIEHWDGHRWLKVASEPVRRCVSSSGRSGR